MDKAAMKHAQKIRDKAYARAEAGAADLHEAVQEFRDAAGAAASALELGVGTDARFGIDDRLRSAHSLATMRAVEYAEAVRTYTKASEAARKEVEAWGTGMDREARKHLRAKFGHSG